MVKKVPKRGAGGQKMSKSGANCVNSQSKKAIKKPFAAISTP
jgi:hypothetical protein